MLRVPIPTPATGWIRAALLVLGVFPCPSVAQNPAVPRAIVPGLWPRITVERVASPVPVPAQGRLHLVYELRLSSFDSREVRVDRLDVLAAPGSGRVLAGYDSTELARILYRPGDTVGLPAPQRIAAGTHVLAFLWVTLDSSAKAPASLVHRLRLATTEGAKEHTTTLEVEAPTVARVTPVVIGPPLRGGPWYTNNGPSNDSRHRRVLVPQWGRMNHGQRFAFDWVKYRGDGSATPEPATYGSEVMAVRAPTAAIRNPRTTTVWSRRRWPEATSMTVTPVTTIGAPLGARAVS